MFELLATHVVPMHYDMHETHHQDLPDYIKYIYEEKMVLNEDP